MPIMRISKLQNKKACQQGQTPKAHSRPFVYVQRSLPSVAAYP